MGSGARRAVVVVNGFVRGPLAGDSLRVLFVSHSFPTLGVVARDVGGMERAAVELAGALGGVPGVVVRELVLRASRRWRPVRAVPFVLSLLYGVPRTVARERAEVVLFSSLTSALVAPVVRRRLQGWGVVLAAVAHGYDVIAPNRVYQAWVRRALAVLDVVLAVSRATARECVGRGAAPGRVRVVGNGVDLGRFGWCGAGWRGGSRFVLLSVGRLVRRKGHGWFVGEVLPGLPEGVEYRVVGCGPEGGAIAAVARRAGVAGRVRLLGAVGEEELVCEYGGADLFVMPNLGVPGDMEGFGLVLLEAGASGVPAVAADVDGIRDVIAPGETGVLVPAGDAEGFRAAIVELLQRPEVRERMGKRAAERVRAEFAWPVVAERYAHELRAAVGP